MLASYSICYVKGKDLKGKKKNCLLFLCAAIKVLCLVLRPHKPQVNNEDVAYLKFYCEIKNLPYTSYIGSLKYSALI